MIAQSEPTYPARHMSRTQLERYALRHARTESTGPLDPRTSMTDPDWSPDVVRARCLGDFDLYVDRRERSLAPSLIQRGIWEAWTTRAIARAVRPDSLTIDVGAHCGYYTMLLASLVGPRGSVVAIEPHAALRGLLERSIAANGYTGRVHVDPRAAWDSSGQRLQLSTPGWLHGSSSVIGHGPPVAGESTTTQTCNTIMIDDLMAERESTLIGLGDRIETPVDQPVGLVKMDVEGSELHAWRGMRRTWERSPDAVACLECAPTPHGRELREALHTEGLSVRVVGIDGEIRDWQGSDEGELVMLWVTR